MEYNTIIRKEYQIVTPDFVISSGEQMKFKPLDEVLAISNFLFTNEESRASYKDFVSNIINKIFTFKYVGYWVSPDNVEHSCCYFEEDYNKTGYNSYLILTKEMFLPVAYDNNSVQLLFGGC